MNLYFMRHGIAAGSGETATLSNDRERELTPKGINRMRKAAKGLSSLSLPLDRILTSPFERARQTAQIVAAALEMENRLEEIEELRPDGSVEDLLSRLSAYSGAKNILLIGHEPLLGRAVSFLLSGPAKTQVRLKKGGLCCLKADDLPPKADAVLQWVLTPKQLRLLAR
jgi:phosphohistidine phosphatase